MKTLDHKLIIYDSNCKVCSSLRDVVLALTSIPERIILPYKDLPEGLTARVDPGKFRNVMALIDTKGGETLYGSEGIAYIFSSQYRLADLLLRIKPVFLVFDFLYKTQAYNRYIIATPTSKFTCDCFPDKITRYRVSYIVMTFLLAIILTALFGMSLAEFVPGLTCLNAAVQAILIAGTGWFVQLILAAGFMKEKALEYAGHLGSIMVAGLLILIPWMLFHAIIGMSIVWIPATSVLVSSLLMLYLHNHRARYLAISPGWTVSWFVSLQATAFLWIYLLYFN